jgi:hypothetical protein
VIDPTIYPAPVLREDFSTFAVVDGLPEVAGERIEKLKAVVARVCVNFEIIFNMKLT